MISAAKMLYNIDVEYTDLKYIKGRNSDIEVTFLNNKVKLL